MIDLLADPHVWTAFLTLTLLELVLGIDNIVFISILVERLPDRERNLARRIGLALAMIMRIGLLFILAWLIGLSKPLFSVINYTFSARDLILITGGLFLLWKSTVEIHQLLEGEEGHKSSKIPATFASVVLQIVIIDAVFSLDSIITAVGLVKQIEVMVSAIVVSVVLMMLFARAIGEFVIGHPTIKMLALSFLFMIGMVLIADGLGHHVPKGYIYFAMAFSVAVEMLNLRIKGRKPPRTPPVKLHEQYVWDNGTYDPIKTGSNLEQN